METGQKREDKDRESMTAFYKEQATEAFKAGNQDLANFAAAGMRRLGYDVADVEIGGPGNMKTQVTVGPDGLGVTGEPLIDPYTKKPKPPGIYDVEVGGGKVSIMPAKDTGDADLKEFEQVTGTPAGSRGTPGYQKGFLGYQRQKKQNITVNVGGGENEYSFPNWTQEAKDKTYQQLAFFGQRPTFGLGKNLGRDAFNKGYGEWLAKHNITPEDIASGRAAAKFTQSNQTQQSKALLSTIDPLLDQLLEAGQVLGNSNLPAYNRAVNFLKREMGSGDITAFNNLRDDVVMEIERGMLGVGVISDFKMERAWVNLNSAQSLDQLKAAIEKSRKVIRARLEAIGTGGTINVPGATSKPAGPRASQPPQGKGGATGQRSLGSASTYLKGAKTQADLTTRVQSLRREGLTDAEIKQAFGGK
jgi:hypothetical protein